MKDKDNNLKKKKLVFQAQFNRPSVVMFTGN